MNSIQNTQTAHGPTTSTTTGPRDTVIATFHSQKEAQKAVKDLKGAGFNDKDIGVASRHDDGNVEKETHGSKAGKGAATGATAGLGVGALWGLGIAAGVLPAIGPVIAGGTLAAIAASAAGAGAAGGLIGALVGQGIPEEEANYYEGEFNKGRTIVTVKCGTSRYVEARRILDDHNAYDFDRRDSDYARDSRSSDRVDADGKLVARKEVLDVDTHEKEKEEVDVRREVHTDTKEVEVPVEKEELVVERKPLDNTEAKQPIGSSKGEEVERVVLKEDEVDVNKKTVAKEEAKVGKRTTSDSVKVEETVKEEDIVVGEEKGRTSR